MTTNQTSLTPQDTKPKFSVFMNRDQIKALVSQAVGKNAQRFTAGIISAVSNSPALEECTQRSILSGALLGEALGLSPSPQLGHYYLVPFKKKDKQGNVVVKCANYGRNLSHYSLPPTLDLSFLTNLLINFFKSPPTALSPLG